MFKSQRSRIASAKSGWKVWSSSGSEEDEDMLTMKRPASSKKLTKVLQTFKPETEIDRKLLKGVILREIDAKPQKVTEPY